MKSINPTLLTNQKLPNGRPFATAALADNGRLHPTQTVTSSYTGGKTIAVECGTFYVRARYKASGLNTLETQKITDPTAGSQWTTWAGLVGSGVATGNSVSLFWTGAYCVVVWQDQPTGDIKYKRSSDGVSWSGTAAVRTGLVDNAACAGVSGTSPNCGLMETYAAQIYWQAYNDAANTWAAAESAGASFTTTTPEIAAFKDTVNNRYVVAIATQGYVSWAFFAIVLYTRAVSAATWSAGQVAFGSASAAFAALNLSQRQVNGYWWLTFYRANLWGTTSFFASASNDGLFFDDPLPTPASGSEALVTLLPAPAAGAWANAYLSKESAVWRLDAYTYFAGAPVVGYQFITGRGGHQEGGGVNARGGVSPTVPTTASTLVAVLDNRDGLLATPRLFSVFTLTRGLVVEGVPYGQSAGAWYVTAFRFLLADPAQPNAGLGGLLEITATDARGLLGAWFADTAYTYRGNTLKFLVERLCALAGVHTVSFDATAAWTDTVSAYTHPIGENALFSLRSLATRLPFEYVPREDGSLYFYVPTASPASVYTFGAGAGEHQAWLRASPARRGAAAPAWSFGGAPWFGAAESVTYLQDIGSPPRTRVAVSLDQTALNEQGRRRSLIINDRRLTTDPTAAAAAAALLLAAQERRRSGAFAAPPSFALEPGDVVTFNSGGYAQSAGPWRVEQIEEYFNQAGAQPFHQLITVRGTA